MSVFRLRYVCTANLCRSPLAERITALRMPPAAGSPWLAVTSAGIHGQDGMPMHPEAARLLSSIGGDPEGFSSRRLTAAMVAGDDLVLTADLAHRDAVIALCPAASRRTFLIGEFTRLLQYPPVLAARCAPRAVADPPTSATGPAAMARELVEAAARYRGRVPWHEPTLDEIADPDGTQITITACAGEIDRRVTQIAAVLAGQTSMSVTFPTQGKDPRT